MLCECSFIVGMGKASPFIRRDLGMAQQLAKAAVLKLDVLVLDVINVKNSGRALEHLTRQIGVKQSGHRFDRWAGGVEVTHVVSQAGVLDLTRAHAEGLGGGAVERFMGTSPDHSSYDLADPQRHVPLEVPIWCVHGDGDQDVPAAYSRDYVRAATAAGGRAELVEVEGDHFVVIDTAHEAWDRIVAVLESL